MLYGPTYLWALFFAISFVAAAPAPSISSEVSAAASRITNMGDSDDTDDSSSSEKSSSSKAGQICKTKYKSAFDSFSIYGVDWDEEKLGKDGAGLKKRIEKCSAVTGWHFETENVEAPWSFHAKGNTIIGTQACIGRAVKASGGPRSSCGGTG